MNKQPEKPESQLPPTWMDTLCAIPPDPNIGNCWQLWWDTLTVCEFPKEDRYCGSGHPGSCEGWAKRIASCVAAMTWRRDPKTLIKDPMAYREKADLAIQIVNTLLRDSVTFKRENMSTEEREAFDKNLSAYRMLVNYPRKSAETRTP